MECNAHNVAKNPHMIKIRQLSNRIHHHQAHEVSQHCWNVMYVVASLFIWLVVSIPLKNISQLG